MYKVNKRLIWLLCIVAIVLGTLWYRFAYLSNPVWKSRLEASARASMHIDVSMENVSQTSENYSVQLFFEGEHYTCAIYVKRQLGAYYLRYCGDPFFDDNGISAQHDEAGTFIIMLHESSAVETVKIILNDGSVLHMEKLEQGPSAKIIDCTMHDNKDKIFKIEFYNMLGNQVCAYEVGTLGKL